jgi:hypothetical protein
VAGGGDWTIGDSQGDGGRGRGRHSGATLFSRTASDMMLMKDAHKL